MKRKNSENNSIVFNNIDNNMSNSKINFNEDIESNNINITGSKKQNSAKEDTIKTYCRIKPIQTELSLFKISENDNKVLIFNGEDANKNLGTNTNIILGNNTNLNKPASFNFTEVFDASASQMKVFKATCLPLINDLFKNKKSGLIFAYGLTNAGKTYTTIGTQNDPGLLPLTLAHIMNDVLDYDDKPEIYCNFIEILNEEVYDLLCEESGKSKESKRNIKEKGKLFYVQNVTQKKIKTLIDFNEALNEGVSKKAHASTLLNPNSSRSHTIFKIIIRFPSENFGDYLESSLSIVDLAGSERAHRSETSGKELHQACKINKSLSVLGKCLDSMRHNSIYVSKKMIPIRESKLTMIFQEYFQGDQNVIMITNICPSKEDLDETLRALSYSCLAKEIKPVRSRMLNNFSNFPIKNKNHKGKSSYSSFSEVSGDEDSNSNDGKGSMNKGESFLSKGLNYNVGSNNNVNFNPNLYNEIENLKFHLKNIYESYEDQQKKYEELEIKNEFLMKICTDLKNKTEVQSQNEVIDALNRFNMGFFSNAMSCFVNALKSNKSKEEKVKYVIINPNSKDDNNSIILNGNKKSLNFSNHISLINEEISIDARDHKKNLNTNFKDLKHEVCNNFGIINENHANRNCNTNPHSFDPKIPKVEEDSTLGLSLNIINNKQTNNTKMNKKNKKNKKKDRTFSSEEENELGSIIKIIKEDSDEEEKKVEKDVKLLEYECETEKNYIDNKKTKKSKNNKTKNKKTKNK